MANQSKEAKRQSARLLVKAILDWGGRGRDIAEFLGVSPTTVSHWRGVQSAKGRQPAIPTDEQIEKLTAILRFRISQNLNFIANMVGMGGFDHQTEVLVVRALKGLLKERADYFAELDHQAAGPGLDESIADLQKMQEKGGPVSLRTFLNPVIAWGDTPPDPSKVTDFNEPIDFDEVRARLTVGTEADERVKAFEEEFSAMLTNRAREALLRPSGKGTEGK